MCVGRGGEGVCVLVGFLEGRGFARLGDVGVSETHK